LRSSSVLLLTALFCILAPAVLPGSAFLGAGCTPAPPASGTVANALGAPVLPQGLARRGGPRLGFAAGTAALALALAAAAGRRFPGGRAAQCGRAVTTKEQIRALEALYRSKDRSGRGWFGFGRKNAESTPEPAMPDPEELPEDLRALVEESRQLAQRVAQLDLLSSFREEMEPVTEEPAIVEEQTLLEEEVVMEDHTVKEEQAAREQQIVTQDSAEVQPASDVQHAPEEQSAMEEQAAEVEEPTEAQKTAMELLDKQNDSLNRVLVMARELDADNQKLKDDLKAAQKLCYELLNKELDTASVGKAAEAKAE